MAQTEGKLPEHSEPLQGLNAPKTKPNPARQTQPSPVDNQSGPIARYPKTQNPPGELKATMLTLISKTARMALIALLATALIALLLTVCGTPEETQAPTGTTPPPAPTQPAATAQEPLTTQNQTATGSASGEQKREPAQPPETPLAEDTPTATGQTTEPEQTIATEPPGETTPTSIKPPPPPATAQPTPTARPAPTDETPMPTPIPFQLEPAGQLTLIMVEEPTAIANALSQEEHSCITEKWTLDKLHQIASGQARATQEETLWMIGCLSDETVARIFLSGFVPGPEPLTLETSACIREAFNEINPRAVMTAGAQADPKAAMAGSMAGMAVTIACLNQDEWERTGPNIGMTERDRREMLCILDHTGGPGQMAQIMTQAQTGNIEPLIEASVSCGADVSHPTGDAPRTPDKSNEPAN